MCGMCLHRDPSLLPLFQVSACHSKNIYSTSSMLNWLFFFISTVFAVSLFIQIDFKLYHFMACKQVHFLNEGFSVPRFVTSVTYKVNSLLTVTYFRRSTYIFSVLIKKTNTWRVALVFASYCVKSNLFITPFLI